MKYIKEKKELKLLKDYKKIIKLFKKIYKLDFDFNENREFWNDMLEKRIYNFEKIYDDFEKNIGVAKDFFNILNISNIKYNIEKISNSFLIKIYIMENTDKLISELEKIIPNTKSNIKNPINKQNKILATYLPNSKYVTVNTEEESKLIQLVKDWEYRIGYFDTSDEKEISVLNEEIYRYLQKNGKDKKLYDIFDSCDFEPDTVRYLVRKLKTYQTEEYYRPILNQLEKVIIMLNAMN